MSQNTSADANTPRVSSHFVAEEVGSPNRGSIAVAGEVIHPPRNHHSQAAARTPQRAQAVSKAIISTIIGSRGSKPAAVTMGPRTAANLSNSLLALPHVEYRDPVAFPKAAVELHPLGFDAGSTYLIIDALVLLNGHG